MKITATYIPVHRAYIIQADEQQIVVPALLAGKLATTIERAIYHQQREKMLQAQKLVEDAHHPAMLPFGTEQQESTIKPRGGRPKGTKYALPLEQRLKKAVAKKKPPEEESPLPFKHTPFR